MSFGAVFADIRRRRRIPMRLFNELAGVSSSYIHDIEQGGVLPSPTKLEAITSVLRRVAEEQGAADLDADARELFRAREQTIYVERLQIDPRLARVFIALRELDDDALETIEEPLLEATRFFSQLEQPTQRGMARVLLDAIATVNTLDRPDRDALGMQLAAGVSDVIQPLKAEVKSVTGGAGPAPVVPKSTPTTRTTRSRGRQHTSR